MKAKRSLEQLKYIAVSYQDQYEDRKYVQGLYNDVKSILDVLDIINKYLYVKEDLASFYITAEKNYDDLAKIKKWFYEDND